MTSPESDSPRTLERAAFEGSPDGLLVVDRNGTIVHVNAKALELFGYVRDELVGSRLERLLPPRLRARLAERLVTRADAVGVGSPQTGQRFSPALHRSGRELPISILVQPIERGARRLLAVAREASAQDDLVERLREAERLYLSSLDALPVCVFRVDREGTLQFVNEATAREVGATKEQLLGRTVADVYPPELAHRYRADDLEVLASGDAKRTVELHVTPETGARRWVDVIKSPVIDSRGEIAGLQGVYWDVSDRVERENELRFHSQILREMREGVLLVRPSDLTILYANPRLLEMFGYERDELVGHSVEILNAGPAAEVAAEIVKGLRRDGCWSGEVLNRRRDGSEFWCQARVSCFEHEAHGVVWLAVHDDITEKKRADEEREKLRADLAHARKMETVGRLAGGVAHDYNNTLAIVVGSAELALASAPASPKLRKRLSAILRAAERSAELTRQLMAFARRQVRSPRVLDLNAAIDEMVSMLRQLIGAHIELRWTPSAALWPIYSDPTQIHQIVTNLCVNARDAITGPGVVEIRTRNGEAGEFEQPAVVLEVADTGVGIDPAMKDRIFEPYFTTKPVGRGTGLGLATVYGIVGQNGGRITVDSTPGATIFRVYFPRVEDASTSRASEPARVPAQLGRERVLLVEDEEELLELTRDALEGLGYQVLAARDVEQADRILASAQRIDLVLTDVVMPGGNGRSVAEAVRRRFPAAATLFVSGYPAEVVSSHGILEGTEHFLQKPWTRRQLAEKIRAVLEASKG